MQGNPKEVKKLAYIAGILDGEGSIMIVRQASKAFMEQRAKAGCYHPNYTPAIRIGMQDREPLDLIVNTTCIGKVYKEKPYHHKKPMYRWMARNRADIIEFLTLVMPYLLVKKKQAKLVFKFARDWIGCNGTRITPEIQAYRENAWMEMRKLNGVIFTPATTKPRGRRGRDLSAPFEAIV